MDKFGLPERTVNEILKYFSSKPEIEKVLIFGSRAKGTYRCGSDIDFAVWLKPASACNASRIAGELDELPTPYKFDVIDYPALTHPGMKQSIDTDGCLFYKK